ncbi:MAG: acyltransferase [Thermodesulfobacteria bacterium]|nr:acyltransferase [Thermodesulfobacteriota bacterium]
MSKILVWPRNRYLLKINWTGLIYCLWKFRSLTLIPFKNTWIRAEKGSTVEGEGILLLGIQWELGRYMPSQLVMRAGAKVKVHEKFKIYSGHSIWVNQNACLDLGSGYINNNLSISCFKSIQIGRNVAIAENVAIWDSDCHCTGTNIKTAPVKIGDNVWIGLNSVILKGVTIGEGAIIAAGSVVNRDVPPYSLAAGVPAVVKKKCENRCNHGKNL